MRMANADVEPANCKNSRRDTDMRPSIRPPTWNRHLYTPVSTTRNRFFSSSLRSGSKTVRSDHDADRWSEATVCEAFPTAALPVPAFFIDEPCCMAAAYSPALESHAQGRLQELTRRCTRNLIHELEDIR